MADHWQEHVFAEWPADAVVALADISGDGRPDAVLTRSEGHHRLSWFERPSDPRQGTWSEHVVEDSLDFGHSLVVCDSEGGQLYIVTAEMHQSPRKRVMRLGNTGRLGIVGANWSGGHQPLELWEQVAGG
jgi:hypothetical protein